MFVEEILPAAHERLFTLRDDAALMEAAKLLHERNVNLVVCNGDGVMVGVITKSDVISQISHCRGLSCKTAASTVMTRDVVSCRPTDLLQAVWSLMKQRGVKLIRVVDQDGRPMGILNARSVVQAILIEAQDEESLLRDYVTGVGYH